jgi:hypothetical protein
LQREAVLSALSPSGGSVCQMTDYIKNYFHPPDVSELLKNSKRKLQAIFILQVLFNVAATCRFASDSDINDLAAVRQGRRKLFYRSNVQESARAVLLSIANRLFLQQLVTGTSHKQLFIFVT